MDVGEISTDSTITAGLSSNEGPRDILKVQRHPDPIRGPYFKMTQALM